MFIKASKLTKVVGNFPCYEQLQKCVYQSQQAHKRSRECRLGSKGHSVVSWLLLKQLNARGGKVSFLSPLVTACVTLDLTYSNYLSQTL